MKFCIGANSVVWGLNRSEGQKTDDPRTSLAIWSALFLVAGIGAISSWGGSADITVGCIAWAGGFLGGIISTLFPNQQLRYFHASPEQVILSYDASTLRDPGKWIDHIVGWENIGVCKVETDSTDTPEDRIVAMTIAGVWPDEREIHLWADNSSTAHAACRAINQLRDCSATHLS